MIGKLKTWICLPLLLVFSKSLYADTALHKIKVHFLYGSKPKFKERKNERKWFGGIHGGHVYIELDSFVYSFYPSYKTGKRFHVFSKDDDRCSRWIRDGIAEWRRSDTPACRVTSVSLMITDSQKQNLFRQLVHYMDETPYDYSFFGNRCASAAYDVLAKAGILKTISNSKNIRRHFYPRPLRTELVLYAKKTGTEVEFKKGKTTRKWERDKRRVRKILQACAST